MSMELCWSDEDLEDVERTAIISGRRIERERIINILREIQAERNANQDWGVVGIVSLMQMIEAEELKHDKHLAFEELRKLDEEFGHDD